MAESKEEAKVTMTEADGKERSIPKRQKGVIDDDVDVNGTCSNGECKNVALVKFPCNHGCQSVLYCSNTCRGLHWRIEHEVRCRFNVCMRCSKIIGKTRYKCSSCDQLYTCTQECLDALRTVHELFCAGKVVNVVCFHK
jgi:hypothetical protein